MRRFIAAAIAGSMLLAAPAQAQKTEQDEQASKLIAEIEAVEMPVYDATRASEAGYRQEYMKARTEAVNKKLELSDKVVALEPSTEVLAEVLPGRWDLMTNMANRQDVVEEAKKYCGSDNKKLATEAMHWYATSMARFRQGSAEDQVGALRAFMTAAPEDDRAAYLIAMVARNQNVDEATRLDLYHTAVTRFPDNRYAKRFSGKIRQIDGIGKPFELSFTDANTGKEVSMNDLRGKVVVIDFWATWCGPCVAEIPKVKEVYEKYHDQGFEIVGVSLDQPEDKGGLDKLRAFCKDREVPWHQYYQGNYWDSEFSTGWGIDAIPAVFLVDKFGNLVTVEARGKLETLVPEYLAKPGPQG